MAVLKVRDEDGAWVVAPSLKFKGGNGVWQNAPSLKYKDKDGNWQKVSFGGTNPTISTLNVGSSVYLNENGSPVEYLIVHKGVPDSTLYDSTCNGVWLLRKDCEAKSSYHYSSNSYSMSTIHSSLNNNFIQSFDANIRNIIQNVTLPYFKYVSSTVSGIEYVSTKAFLLSMYELGFTKSNNSTLPVDGAKLDYFETGTGTDANAKRIAYWDGSTTAWWTRSARNNDSEYVFMTSTSGSLQMNYCYNQGGIRPAVILPYTAKIDPNTNTIIG